MDTQSVLNKAAVPPWSYDDTYQLTGEHRTGSHAYRDTYTYDPAEDNCSQAI